MKAAADDINFRLYLIADAGLTKGRPLPYIVEEAIKGGITAVQVRMKDGSYEDILREADRLREITEKHSIPLIINDRVDVAAKISADGVHLGQEDTSYDEARTVLGDEAVIGLSVSNEEQIYMAEAFNVSYLGIGSIFPTGSKRDVTIVGLAGIIQASRITEHDLIAIGGVNESNAQSVIKAGTAGIAVISAICSADNPAKAAQKLRELVDESLEERRRFKCQDRP